MDRFLITLKVSMFAYHQEDAEHLSKLLQDRVDDLLGRGQAIVTIKSVAPDRETVIG